MAKQNFTAEKVLNFTCEAGKQQTIHWDAKVPGLGLRITAKGAKSYVFESRLHGKTIRLTIGNVRTWTVGKAQAEATKYRVLTDQGIDPRQELVARRVEAEAEQKEMRRATVTFAEAWEGYLESRKSRWGSRTYLDHVKLASPGGDMKKVGSGKTKPGPLASLRPLRLTELDSQRIAKWLDVERQSRPTSTALGYRLLRAFVRWTADIPELQGLIPSGACTSKLVREAVPKTKPKEGDCLQREQLAPWFAAVGQISSPVIRTYLQALLLTGARREEMASLLWKDIDFTWRTLSIKDKVDGERVIPLPPYLCARLIELRDWSLSSGLDTSKFVFTSATSASGRLEEPRIAHNLVLSRAGLPHLTIHGLRRSFGTLCEWIDVPLGVSAQIMGHKPSALAEKHYRRRPIDMLRKWHNEMEAWILQQAGVHAQHG